MQAVDEVAKLRHAADVDALNVDIHSAANEEEAKGILIGRLRSMLEPALKRMDIPWSQAIPAIEKVPLDELNQSIESGSVAPIILKISDDGLQMPENARELLMAKIQPLAKSRLAQMGVSWRQAAPAFDQIPTDVLKECLVTGKIEPAMAKLTFPVTHISHIKSRYDEARAKMQEAVALGRKEVKMYEVWLVHLHLFLLHYLLLLHHPLLLPLPPSFPLFPTFLFFPLRQSLTHHLILSSRKEQHTQ